MGRGSSKVWGARAYAKAVRYIQKSNIPAAFHTPSKDGDKAIYRAIARYGTLTAQDREIYNEIKYYPGENRLYRSGDSIDTTGFNSTEIEGAKKFMAHSMSVNRR